MRNAGSWVWLGVVSLAALVSCGDDEADSEKGNAGSAAGAGGGGSGGAAGLGGDNIGGDNIGGDNIGGDNIGGDNIGGHPDSPLATDLQALAERGLTKEDVELDPRKLAGQSFTLLSSLCSPEGAGGEGNIGGASGGGDPVPTLHVRAAEDGGLEAVTYTSDGGVPLVAISAMRRASLGWELSNVPVCASLNYVFEREYETNRYVARKVHVVFVRGDHDSKLKAVVAASGGKEPRVSEAELDVLAPSFSQLDLQYRLGVDGIFNTGFSRHFMFSEPMPLESDIVVADSASARVDVEPIASNGYLVGFTIDDILSGDFSVEGKLTDLAGNDLDGSRKLAGIKLAPIDGSFETAAAFISGDQWISDEPGKCDHVGAAPTSAGTASLVSVPALAGSSSFLLGFVEAPCSAWLRVATQPSDTALKLDARIIGDWSEAELPTVRVCFDSLGVGGDDECATLEPAWTIDEAYGGEGQRVSSVQTLTVPLPANGSDFLVGFHPDEQLLWLDSLRTE